jgi:hypothetical protein
MIKSVMEPSVTRTPKRPLLDRSYWLSRPIEERFAAAQPKLMHGRGREHNGKAGLLRLAKLLNGTKIEYLVVGGYALAAHGVPRETEDLDIWIEPSRGNVHSLLQALNAFGFGSLDISEPHLTNTETHVQAAQLGHPPPRIDLVTALDGIRFNDCYPRRSSMALGNLMLPIIDLEDLRANKRAAGRVRDLADLDSIDDASPDLVTA